MKKRVILPLSFDVPIQSYPEYSISHSIIKSNYDDATYLYWLLSKFQNCYFCDVSRTHKFMHCMSDGWATNAGLLKWEFINLSPSFFNESRNLVELYRAQISLNSYPFGANFLFGTEKDRFVFYGYDDSQRVFYYAEHTDKGLQKQQIGYSELASIVSRREEDIATDFISAGKDFSANLEPDLIKKRLLEYVASTTTDCLMNDKIYGFKAIERLVGFIGEKTSIDRDIHRYLKCFSEQKMVIRRCMEFLFENCSVDSRAIEISREVEFVAGKILSLANNEIQIFDLQNEIKKTLYCEREYNCLLKREVGNH